ncbi:MAG TPA: HAD-IIB family hydrolase [Patescibacteria group bacterium]|nr:HAD-IIB family hydrolase [Patescibacteria group bacterium]
MRSLKFNNKYKALIVDVDGTLIPNAEKGMPSEKVTKAIKKAKEKIHVAVASGRPYFMLSHIFKHLELSGPAITNNGAQIVNSQTGEIIYEQLINKEDVIKTCLSLKKLKISVYIQDCEKDIKFTKKYKPKKPYNIFALGLTPQKTATAILSVSHLPTIAIHEITGWKTGTKGIIASHVNATKQHAVLELARNLNIKTHEIIAVGDGHNDFPLFMAAGFRIAMGNAVEELKDIADFVAPDVNNDGLAYVINKFIL